MISFPLAKKDDFLLTLQKINLRITDQQPIDK